MELASALAFENHLSPISASELPIIPLLFTVICVHSTFWFLRRLGFLTIMRVSDHFSWKLKA